MKCAVQWRKPNLSNEPDLLANMCKNIVGSCAFLHTFHLQATHAQLANCQLAQGESFWTITPSIQSSCRVSLSWGNCPKAKSVKRNCCFMVALAGVSLFQPRHFTVETHLVIRVPDKLKINLSKSIHSLCDVLKLLSHVCSSPVVCSIIVPSATESKHGLSLGAQEWVQQLAGRLH